MNYAHELTPSPLPVWLDFDGRTWDTHYMSDEQLAAQGWLPLIYDPEGALLGYAEPVEETRDYRLVAVAYALATPEQEAAERLRLAKIAKKAEVRIWLSSINGRAYMHAEGADDFDDLLTDLRNTMRNMINTLAAKLLPADAARITAAEARSAFTTASPTFDLLAKAKEARTTMLTQIDAITSDTDVLAYTVNDAKAKTVHAAAYPTASPTLAALLIAYPVRV